MPLELIGAGMLKPTEIVDAVVVLLVTPECAAWVAQCTAAAAPFGCLILDPVSHW